MSHAVSRRPFTAQSGVQSQANPLRFLVDKVALWPAFLRLLRFSPVFVNPAMLSSHLQLHGALIRRTNARNLGTFQKSKSLLEIGEE